MKNAERVLYWWLSFQSISIIATTQCPSLPMLIRSPSIIKMKNEERMIYAKGENESKGQRDRLTL